MPLSSAFSVNKSMGSKRCHELLTRNASLASDVTSILDGFTSRTLFKTANAGRKAPTNVFGSAAKRVRVQVGVTSRGRRLCVTQQPANDRKPKTQACTDTRMRMAKVVYAHAGQAGSL